MSYSITHAELPTSTSQKPFGPGSHAVNDPNTLLLGAELTRAAAAHRVKRATAEQMQLLRETDAAMRQALIASGDQS